MKHKCLMKADLLFVFMLAWAGTSRADSLEVTLAPSSQTVVQGTTVVTFDATILNPSTTDTIFLNGDSWSTDSPLVAVDDSLFDANAPIFLAPGAASDLVALFNVDLSPGLALGIYTGDFSILGGADGGAGTAFIDLADAGFSVDVTGPVSTPEPGTLLLLCSGLGIIALSRRRRELEA